ncbi:MAG: hypothetical protein JSV20_03705 [Candidatus Bathyarchaeota archaeon]|nr:MAG: hypothetical protein JSV20_03705 [Candidatus Bathyarchaeota archaeon]
MANRTVIAVILLIAVSAVVGWNQLLAMASNGANRLAVIEDINGDYIAVEPVSDDVWNSLVTLYHSGERMWIGGRVETFLTIRPDPHYRWGFRFTSKTIIVAEVTAEGLQSTLRNISENLDYWLHIGSAYVFAKVTEITDSTGKLDLTVQLSANPIVRGDPLLMSATLLDEAAIPIEGATVTATIGNLEILFLLVDQDNGNYQGIIDTSIVKEGLYELAITAEKEGYESDHILLALIVKAQS